MTEGLTMSWEEFKAMKVRIAALEAEHKLLNEYLNSVVQSRDQWKIDAFEVESELSSLRRELCETRSNVSTPAEYATARGWGYLYEEVPR